MDLGRYVKAHFCGAKQKTKVQHETAAPVWFETLEFDEVLPRNLAFAPELVLEVANCVMGAVRHNGELLCSDPGTALPLRFVRTTGVCLSSLPTLFRSSLFFTRAHNNP